MRAGLERWQATGAKVALTGSYLMLADGLRILGDHLEALALVEKSQAISVESGECHAASDALRLKGILHLTVPRPDRGAAEGAFRQAIQVARTPRAPLWELRAAVELAALLRDSGQIPKAREVLSPIYSTLSQEPEFAILRKAKTILQSL